MNQDNQNITDQELISPSPPSGRSTKLMKYILLMATIISLGLNVVQCIQIRSLRVKTKLNVLPSITLTPSPTIISPTIEVSPSSTPPVKGWIRHTFSKPLGISLYTPSQYLINTNPNTEETWGINIESDTKMKITMCVGCQLTSSIKACGISGENCEVLKEYQQNGNNSYAIEIYKDTKKFAQITGQIYKSSGEDIPLRVTTTDGNTPSVKDLDNLKIMLSSVTSP